MYNILYLLPSYNLYGGTPKKTLDLIKYSNNRCFIYVWSNSYSKEFKELFENSDAIIYEGSFGRNIVKHITYLLKIIREKNIQIIQTQFSFGELLAGLLKILRPKLKIIIAFVAPFSPAGLKCKIVKYLYKRIDAVVYISEYVKNEKITIFPILGEKKSKIVYNGTEKRKDNGDEVVKMRSISLLDIAGLIDWKNAELLLNSMTILLSKKKVNNIYLYIAGDGPMRSKLEGSIKLKGLEKNITLLGYQYNVGGLLDQCDIFVHPAYAEGFGIAVAEGMIAEKPIIVANAGALPELIENEKTGLIVDPFNPEQWAEAIIRLIEDKEFASKLASNAKKKAEEEFSIEKFVSNYENLYRNLLS